ncbi:MAG: PSD1 and planctomycete cytochrome C domain-containing protein [Planctomycetota bacterium]
MTVALALLTFLAPQGPSPSVDFNRDVRPILSQHCFQCHGPSALDREADMRLDRSAVLQDERRILVPSSPEESELYRRITNADEDERMPPASSKTPPTPEQIAVLRAWIEQGATYQSHWSFQPIRDPALATVQNTAWPINPIDTFVLARLEEKDLEVSPRADRRTLIRRVTFDLTGMPPTPRAVQEFVDDPRPDAYERIVDRLLGSKPYAERMTLAWMDVARYGDSSVFHADGPRDMWPWRDWAIEAYYTNKPFDRFTVEQLAGDLIPNATREQRIASGFLRNNGTSDEGGAIDEEFRVRYMVDRVKTTGNAWLGLSTECAQCHSHKFDPITQEDYYRFFAFFNQSREKGMQSRNGNEPPLERVPSPAQEREDRRLTHAITVAQGTLREAQPPEGQLLRWAEEQRAELVAPEQPQLGSWYLLGPFEAASQKEAFQTGFGPEQGVDLQAAIDEHSWAERTDFEDGKTHSLGSASNSAFYLYRTIHVAQATQRSVSLGSDDSLQLYLNDELVLARDVGRGVAPDQDRADLALQAGTNHLLLKICNGGGPSGFYFKLLGLPFSDVVAAALLLEDCDRGILERGAIREHYVRNVWAPGTEMVATLSRLTAEQTALGKAIPTVMVMQDLPEGRQTYVLDRGQYDAPRKDQPVSPGVFEFLLSMPEAAPANRLGLARWLVDSQHPLTARVTVNRYWAMLFGTGIVETVMDFGSQGAWPSHPDLLDWLASDFIAGGWNVQATLKQMVMSATYRQSSKQRPELRELDPENRLLARAPRYRLQGEHLRDQALSVSGLLVDLVGGPSVKPYQPEGLWNEVSLDGNLRFVQDHGDKLYRKSMYIYWKRSAPMPAMTTFDAPTREKCTIQRQRTNTPLQALVTLNDDQFVEAARHLAERMLKGGETFAARLDVGFVLCTARPADDLRRSVMSEIFEEQLAVFTEDPARAEELLSVGESERDTELDQAQHAAWTVLASMLLNLDETLTRE